MSSKRDIMTEFTKDELVEIAKELGIGIKPFNRSYTIIDAITKDLNDNGIPEVDDCSDVMWEFLQFAGWIDEEGEIIQESDNEESDSGTDNNDLNLTVIQTPEIKPECFSLADIRDPSCIKCRVFDACHEQRVASRPPCFGLHFSPSADECADCIEVGPCRQLCLA